MIKSILSVGLLFTMLISYTPEAHFNTIRKDNRFYIQTYDKMTVANKLPKSNEETLKLLPYFVSINTDKDYINPLDIDGVSEDIIFNYNSNLESSSKYLSAMINNGWEIESLISDNKRIVVELYKDNQTCKIVIEDNKLKVYLKQLSNINND